VLTAGDGIDVSHASTAETIALNINGLTAESTIAPAADYIVMYDASATAHRKVLVSDLVGASDTNIGNTNLTLSAARTLTMGGNSLTFDGTGDIVFADNGNITTAGDVAVNGGDLTTTATTASLFNTNATTVNIAGDATTLSIGAATGTATINNADVVITGNLTVNGTTTTVNSTTLTVDDKNIELGSVTTPTDATADGGGITLKGTTDKTLSWDNATDAWTSSEHIALAAGKDIILNGATSGAVTLDVPATVTPFEFTLPSAVGLANQVLITDASGNHSYSYAHALRRTRTEAANYTVVLSDDVILLNSTTATVTLPDPTTCVGQVFTIKCIAATPTTANVASAAGTIDGEASFLYTAQYESINCANDGTNWFII
jgi:hypothetical protein